MQRNMTDEELRKIVYDAELMHQRFGIPPGRYAESASLELERRRRERIRDELGLALTTYRNRVQISSQAGFRSHHARGEKA